MEEADWLTCSFSDVLERLGMRQNMPEHANSVNPRANALPMCRRLRPGHEKKHFRLWITRPEPSKISAQFS
jgi:hypothetical protein